MRLALFFRDAAGAALMLALFPIVLMLWLAVLIFWVLVVFPLALAYNVPGFLRWVWGKLR